jgi:hypothetical protein
VLLLISKTIKTNTMNKPTNVEYKKQQAVKKGLKEAKRRKLVSDKLRKVAFQKQLEKQRKREKFLQMLDEARDKRSNGMYNTL